MNRFLLPIPNQRDYFASTNRDKDIDWTDPLVLAIYSEFTLKQISADITDISEEVIAAEMLRFIENYRPRAFSAQTIEDQRQRAIASIKEKLLKNASAKQAVRSHYKLVLGNNPWRNEKNFITRTPIYDKSSPFTAMSSSWNSRTAFSHCDNIPSSFEHERINPLNYNQGSVGVSVMNSRDLNKCEEAWLQKRSLRLRYLPFKC